MEGNCSCKGENRLRSTGVRIGICELKDLVVNIRAKTFSLKRRKDKIREKRLIIVDNCNKEIFVRVNDTSIWYIDRLVKEGRNRACLLERKYSA